MEQVSEFVFMFCMGIVVLLNTMLAERNAGENNILCLIHLFLAAFILTLMCMVKS